MLMNRRESCAGCHSIQSSASSNGNHRQVILIWWLIVCQAADERRHRSMCLYDWASRIRLSAAISRLIRSFAPCQEKSDKRRTRVKAGFMRSPCAFLFLIRWHYITLRYFWICPTLGVPIINFASNLQRSAMNKTYLARILNVDHFSLCTIPCECHFTYANKWA